MTNRKTNYKPKSSKPLAKTKTLAMGMSSTVVPLPNERYLYGAESGETMKSWGDNNLYPNYLVSLFNDSPINKGIIKGKANYLIGQGLHYKNSDKKADFLVNDDEDINYFVKKLIFDYLIFGFYAVEVIYDNSGNAIKWNHLPGHHVRMNENKTKYWYNDDWYLKPSQFLTFDAWKSNSTDDIESRIFVFQPYAPSVNQAYQHVPYSGAIKAIQTDIDIRDFHSHNINSNFSASSIVTFFSGEPEDDQIEALAKSVESSYTGKYGKKIILNFAEAEQDKGVEVSKLSADNWETQFLALKEDTQSDIIIAHQIVSPLLIGVKTEGQLGGSQELETAYEIFRRNFVDTTRQELEDSLNKLFNGIFLPIEFKDTKRLFKEYLDSTVKASIMTVNELRATESLPPLKDGDVIQGKAPVIQAMTGLNQKFEKEDDDKDERYEKVKHLGYSKDDYIVITSAKFHTNRFKFEVNQTLTNYLIESPLTGKTFGDIKKDFEKKHLLTTTIQEIRQELAKLVVANIVKMHPLLENADIIRAKEELDVTNTAKKEDDTTTKREKVETMYSYEGIIDSRNRNFCSKLLNSNKYFSREDIQTMSELLGYDVFKYSGGKNCRGHKWVANTVVKR